MENSAHVREVPPDAGGAWSLSNLCRLELEARNCFAGPETGECAGILASTSGVAADSVKRFQDHFSEHADAYASHRPVYPDAFADFLADVAPGRNAAWEAGCGSGQLTTLLATRFRRVIATDASEEQIARAPDLPGVTYRCVRAESTRLPAGMADLCVAAQAVHWFDLDAYYAEVRRVGRKGGVVALATYALMDVDEAVDAVVRAFYNAELDAHWPPERRLVEEGYASLPFPFEEIAMPNFEMYAEWTLDQLIGYIRTWSGVRASVECGGGGAVDAFERDLERAWGDPAARRPVRWPVAGRIGRLR